MEKLRVIRSDGKSREEFLKDIRSCTHDVCESADEYVSEFKKGHERIMKNIEKELNK